VGIADIAGVVRCCVGANRHSDRDADSDADRYCDAHPHGDTNPDSDTDGYADRNAYCHLRLRWKRIQFKFRHGN
jgi:hypothetical protein